MALNWNAFLTDEGLTLPDEQWNDFSHTTSTDTLSVMPKPSSGRKHALGEDLTGFDSFMNGNNYDENLFSPNDYFLSDLEVLQPFGDTLIGEETTSESSPEPTSGMSYTGPFTQSGTPLSHTPASTSNGLDQSPQMASLRRSSVQRARTYPNPNYEAAMFPNSNESTFAEDITYPNGPSGAVQASRSSLNVEKETTHKRNRNNPDNPDMLSACWTSPLCPNHDQDGPAPSPSSCGGGCAPFLFAEEAPNLSIPYPEPQEVTAADGVVEIQPRPKKRSESTSSSEPTGRQFPNPNSTSTRANTQTPPTQLKNEPPEDSTQQAEAPAEDGKPKSRRRLPHNQVERKYRESLNTQLESLRRVVPALQQNRACDGADIEDLPAPSKPSKAVILASATAYIKQVEKENKAVQDENQILRTRIKALQALVKCDDCSLMQYVMDLKINNNQQPHQHLPPIQKRGS